MSGDFSVFDHFFEGNEERIVWHNWRLPRHKLLLSLHLLGFSTFLPLTLFLLYQLSAQLIGSANRQIDWASIVISLLFITLFGLVVLFTGQKLLSLTWREEIVISEKQISLVSKGLLARQDRHIPVAEIWRLSFEKYRHNQDQEFRHSINIFHKRRVQLAYWMRHEEGHRLYKLLAEIIDRRGWSGLIKIEERGNQPRSA